uniref:ORF204 n=1 Tax=Allomyces macrogynus TaxID=28583 RepID=Q33765_ALLMA|nr:hypothetical protein AlmafMp29 [Allomyces macrogynus]AAC49249.1 ORF204 [Allomyces macrogynus]
MIASAKIIGAGLISIGLAGAGVGVEVVIYLFNIVSDLLLNAANAGSIILASADAVVSNGITLIKELKQEHLYQIVGFSITVDKLPHSVILVLGPKLVVFGYYYTNSKLTGRAAQDILTPFLDKHRGHEFHFTYFPLCSFDSLKLFLTSFKWDGVNIPEDKSELLFTKEHELKDFKRQFTRRFNGNIETTISQINEYGNFEGDN